MGRKKSETSQAEEKHCKLRSGDEVMVIAGKDKGRSGRIVKIDRKRRKVVVAGINRVKKHQKPDPQRQRPGGIIEKEAAIDMSNVAIINAQTGKADRIGFVVDEGKKRRIFKSDQQLIDG